MSKKLVEPEIISPGIYNGLIYIGIKRFQHKENS